MGHAKVVVLDIWICMPGHGVAFWSRNDIALYFSLDLPKTIINRAIGGKQFPQHLFGFDFNQVTYLLILCGLFLILVFINGAFKYYINTFKGRLGERMLRRLRYQLYHRMLRFPLSQFSKTSSAQIIPMITSECESLRSTSSGNAASARCAK